MSDIFDWSSTASSNTTVDGIGIDTGMSPANVDNSLRAIMALVRNTFVSGWQGLFAGTTAGIPKSDGSGGVTAVAAPAGEIVGTTDPQELTNKTLTSPTIEGGTFTGGADIAVADGGTGASTAAAAHANIVVTSSSLIANGGYRVHADGFKETWGYVDVSANSSGTYTVPVAHSSFIIPSIPIRIDAGNNGQTENCGIADTWVHTTLGTITLYNAENFTVRVYINTKGV